MSYDNHNMPSKRSTSNKNTPRGCLSIIQGGASGKTLFHIPHTMQIAQIVLPCSSILAGGGGNDAIMIPLQ